jgi:uncharacterized protein (DUF2384 family)
MSGVKPTENLTAIKSQLESEIADFQTQIYLRRAKLQAIEIFGNQEAAETWLRESNPALNGNSPSQVLNNLSGFERVIDLLNAIRHGVFL